MTNIPFDEEEARHWRDAKPVPTALKAALRVDQLLAGDWPAVAEALKVAGVKANLAGVRSFLEAWVMLMKPVYLMASTPPDYQYPPSTLPTPPELSSAHPLSPAFVPLPSRHWRVCPAHGHLAGRGSRQAAPNCTQAGRTAGCEPSAAIGWRWCHDTGPGVPAAPCGPES